VTSSDGDYERILNALQADPRYLRNLEWGEARPGHPEGTVRAHIAELERNLDALRSKLSLNECWKLRLLIHTHDTLKGEADEGAPIAAPNSHASLARRFLADFSDDPDLLAMVQYHDEPFALWRQYESQGACNQDRLRSLLAGIHDWDLFLAFNIIDGCTEGKDRQPLYWLFGTVAGLVQSRFSEADIL
jgi:hypothetical protein